MRRWRLSKRDRRRLLERLRERYPGLDTSSIGDVEIVVEEDSTIYLVDGVPAFIEAGEGLLIPHLLYLLRRGANWLPGVVVDEGAVKPISRGADLMRPGVVEFTGDFREGDIVVVLEPSRRLPLAVHQALVSREEAERMEKGKVSRRLHHVGDRWWRLGKSL